MSEHLYFDVEYAKGGRAVEGTAVRYGDKAARRTGGGVYYDTIRPGSLKIDDATLNIQHDRKRLLGRTNGGGLSFQDGPDRLRVRAEFAEPLTRDAADALQMLEKRILRAWSLELSIRDYKIDDAERTRVITGADVTGIALVDRPGFTGSAAVLREFSDYQDGAFEGSYKYNQDETISDEPGRAVVRKRKFRPGAFRQSIQDPGHEVGLLTSRNPNDAVASKRSGTLFLEDDDETLNVTASSVADTAAWRDLLAKRDAGLALALQPVIKADSGEYEDIPENPGDGTALVRTYSAVKLLGFMVTPRPTKGSESEVNLWAQSPLGLTVH
ncbi:MAG: hypothetical protein F4207_10205 [Gemmatimonadetes bacterium]|nr:hypothetical protein [Gemmatimonadota bacterium]MYG16779.1 hypothetical protein [Gemmatimonadota bacterium]